ncbi:sigma-70 family RNA polymerase sigma factor [Leptolyngbyaceae cyanobacterium CCMR0082]|uniref:Sigma-70 family RNA polymerase sigma factor n=2 Tax=Adonisia turfae TaxID=2950184 RepID=A0A6M0SBG3_9CYAN|nr:sigma-70 family RNA polymerase sigma factor [Leptothoe sp. LEGE 181152]NEZ54708.1 sigma-70 family RNA polymerase sigma factor [Adonisia turfae CCMR0081]NEZ65012.1 sigma-70 family RNA polymerase sigma factor [Adonisia turfae CCMR0082]
MTQAVDEINQVVQSVMEHETDGALVVRMWEGDVSALGSLYDRYGSLVYSIALKGLRRVSEAEDLTQEVFLKLMRTRSYNPRRGSLASYLTTLTRSRVIDRLRAQSTQQKYLSQWHQNQFSVDSATPMKHITQQERRALVREALTTLKAQQREVLELSYYEGQSQRDIAERLGVPLGTVKSWARRGLLQLRKQLDVLREDL